jgi:type II secretory pathway component PulF
MNMPTYSYLGVDAKGLEVSGNVTAQTLHHAIHIIRRLGHFPTEVKDTHEQCVSPPKRLHLFGRKNSKRRELLLFTRQLADLALSGTSLTFALSILHDRRKKGIFRDILGELASDLSRGEKLSDAAAKHPILFDEMLVEMIRAGEANGNLPAALESLADFVEKREAFTRENRNAFWQSLIGFVLAYELTIYLSLLVTGGGYIPALILMDFSEDNTFRWTGLFSIQNLLRVCAIIAVVLIIRFVFRLPWMKPAGDWLLLKLPLFGRRARCIATAQFARAFAALLSAGLPSAKAFELAGTQVANRSVARVMRRLSESIRKGEPLEKAVREIRIFSPMTASLLSSAEMTGNFGSILKNIAAISEENARFQVSRFHRTIIVIAASIVLLSIAANATIIVMEKNRHRNSIWLGI